MRKLFDEITSVSIEIDDLAQLSNAGVLDEHEELEMIVVSNEQSNASKDNPLEDDYDTCQLISKSFDKSQMVQSFNQVDN